MPANGCWLGRERGWREQHDFGIAGLVGRVGGGFDRRALADQHRVNPVRIYCMDADDDNHRVIVIIIGAPANELRITRMLPVYDVRLVGRIWNAPAGVVL